MDIFTATEFITFSIDTTGGILLEYISKLSDQARTQHLPFIKEATRAVQTVYWVFTFLFFLDNAYLLFLLGSKTRILTSWLRNTSIHILITSGSVNFPFFFNQQIRQFCWSARFIILKYTQFLELAKSQKPIFPKTYMSSPYQC